MSQPAYSPTLLGIPPELRFKIYEHLYGGEVLTLKPGSPLHPDLSLLRVCKTIYAEARVTVIKNVKLRILARSSILILPHEIKQAWLCYAQDVTISHGSLLFALREVNFLSSAKWLQTLRVGYNFTTDEHDSYEAYRAATNDIRDYNDGLSPITSKDKVWDDYLLNGVIERSSPTSTIPIYGWSQCRLEMLQNLILNKGRGFKLTGLLRATLGHYQTVGTKPVSTELHLTFDFDTFEIAERKVWLIMDDTNDHVGHDREPRVILPIITVDDARTYLLDEEDREARLASEKLMMQS